MGLETVVDIDDLVITNPLSTDAKSQGDDHLRIIKTAVKNAFPGFTGSVIVLGTTGGSANTYTLTPSTALPAYAVGTLVIAKITDANTGASTMNISGLGAGAIQSVSGAALTSGDLPASRYAWMVVTATTPVFQLLGITKNYVDQLAMTAALPAQILGLLISDGTNASFSKTLTGFALNTVRATVASHATTSAIWAAAGNEIDFTGAETITNLPAAPVAGASRILHHAGTPTWTNNANISVQGAANYTAEAGDIITVHAITTTTFRISIEKAAGHARAGAVTASGLTQTTARLLGRTTAGTGAIEEITVSGATFSGGALTINSALTLVATLTPTAAAAVNSLSSFSATYDNYLIIGEGITVAADDTLLIRLATGGALDTGSNYYEGASNAGDGTAGSSVEVQAVESTGVGMSFEMVVKNVNDATRAKGISIRSQAQSAAATWGDITRFGIYVATNTASGIGFYWSGGSNFGATGKIRIYGFANS